MKNLLKVLVPLFVGGLLISGVIAFPHIAHAAPAVRTGGGFPSDAVWTYRNENIQAWLGQLENDAVSGDHYNLHIQPPGGGYDWANYHITYNGVQQDENGNVGYQWNVYDSVSGNNTVYNESIVLEPDAASAYATSEIATDIGDAVGDSGLTNALMEDLEADSTAVDGLVDALAALIVLIVDNQTQQVVAVA
jgi:hypothetical protein